LEVFVRRHICELLERVKTLRPLVFSVTGGARARRRLLSEGLLVGMSLDSLDSDIIGLICACVPLRERLRVCFALSKTFREAAQRQGGKLALIREGVVPLTLPLSWIDGHNIVQPRFGSNVPSLRPTEIFFTGFKADAGELPETLLAHQSSVVELHFELCTGKIIPWLSALEPLKSTCTSLKWNNPAVPIQEAMSIISSMRTLQRLEFSVCMMPQHHDPSPVQMCNALLPIGLLATIPTLRHVTLMQLFDDDLDDDDLFGYTGPYRLIDLDCQPDLISGLCLGLSALHQVTSVESDLLGDWGAHEGITSFVDAFELMLNRLPGLLDLGTVFFMRAATWQQLHRSVRHPSLECLRLRYSDWHRADLEWMAKGIRDVFPRLRELSLELTNNQFSAEESARLLSRIKEHPSLQVLFINWDERNKDLTERNHFEEKTTVLFDGLAPLVKLYIIYD
jgi:hypothetical protein